MKAKHFVPFLCSALCAAPAFGQRTPDGLREIDPSTLRVISGKTARDILRANAAVGDDAQPAAAASSTLPVWNYTVTAAQDGKTYSGSIVGTPPTSGLSTRIPTMT